jgi:ribosomal protein S18 acetylase RimI-like enzyme
MRDSTNVSLLTPKLTLRRLVRRDLPRISELTEQGQALRSAGSQRSPGPRAHERLGYIAEADGRLAGYLICSVRRRGGQRTPKGGNLWIRFLHRLIHLSRSFRLQIDLLDLAVAPEWPAADVEPVLLARLDQEVRRRGRAVELIVPETNLPAQLFLRETGYRAIEVLRGHYGREDGYLMVRA